MTEQTPNPAALPRHEAVRDARRLGLLISPDIPDTVMIAEEWRPLWWAITEIGWVDDPLLHALDRARGLPAGSHARRWVRRLDSVGWVGRDRPPGRPPQPIACTPTGRIVFEQMGVNAPLWTASGKEVARRALAVVLSQATEPMEISAATSQVVDVAGQWGRLVRQDDARHAVARWRREGLLYYIPAAHRRWLVTERGRRCLRAVARAAGARLPRQSRPQDQDHDLLVARLAAQLASSHPGVIGVLRVARRTYIRAGDRAGQWVPWIIPDGLVGFHTEDGPVVVAVEVERNGRYEDLARHIRNYADLAAGWPPMGLRILVITGRVTPGRRMTVTDAVADAELSHPSVDLDAAVTTVAAAVARLRRWGIAADTPTFAPPE